MTRPDLTTVFQTIVDLRGDLPVGVEALTRGGSGGRVVPPMVMFGEARARGAAAVRRLDVGCLHAALDGLPRDGRARTVFVNLEPVTIASLTEPELAALAHRAPDGVDVVMEVTERALLDDPARLVAGVDRVRAVGWRIALDDAGADPAALSLLPFLAPDVIKLDLRLVQEHSPVEVASIVDAVRAESERTGAVVLAEGIETEEHRGRALSLGAQLGQGWLFGRPDEHAPEARAVLPRRAARTGPRPAATTPLGALTEHAPAQRIGAPLLTAMTRQIEQQALLLDRLAVVVAHVRDPRSFTGALRLRFEALASSTALTAVLGPGMPLHPAHGVHGSPVGPDDPLSSEWVLTVVSPSYAAAIAAREVEPAPDGERRFDYAITLDRGRVLTAAGSLLRRLQPLTPGRAWATPRSADAPALPSGVRPRLATTVPDAELPDLLVRAISTATNAITISAALPSHAPLVYVNEAFLALTGYREDEVLGRDCRFLQGEETDRAQVRRIGQHLAAGQAVSSVLVNYRRDGTRFVNELVVSPVRNAEGQVTHFIGNQVDVTQRVRRQERIAYLALHDPLTGRANRAHLDEHLELELARAQRAGTGVAVLFVDLVGFKGVNDSLGHRAGDRVLTEVAARFATSVRAGDLLARLGGDEFAVVLGDLPADDPSPALRVADELRAALLPPVLLDAAAVTVRATIGVAMFPADAATSEELIAAADTDMYRSKVR